MPERQQMGGLPSGSFVVGQTQLLSFKVRHRFVEAGRSFMGRATLIWGRRNRWTRISADGAQVSAALSAAACG